MPKKYFSRSVALTFLAFLASSGLALAQSAFEDPGARTSSGATGDLRSVNEKTTGVVTLGSSTQVVVLFRNEDTKPIKVNGVNLYPSSNVTATLGENQCAESPILPGEICASTILVKGLQAGNYRIEMLVRHDGRTKLLTATVDGTVESSGDEQQDILGDIEVKPTDIDFGTLTQSRIQLRPVVLRNITSKAVTISDVAINAGENSGFSVNADCGELATGAACIATVKWVPQQPGPSSAMIVVSHDGPTRISTVALKGEYNPADSAAAQFFPQAVPGRGLLVSSQEEVDFGTDVAQSASITISLVNSGDSPLKINSIRTSGSKNGLSVEKRGCISGTVLQPVEACPLTLTLDPQRAGNIVDDVQVSHDGTRGILVIPVRGSTAATEGGFNGGSGAGGLISDSELLGSVSPLSVGDLVEGDGVSESGVGNTTSSTGVAQQKSKMLREALSGYGITSFGKDRAVLTKDGTGKIVYGNSQTVLGGLPVNVKIHPNVIEFEHEGEKAFLYFDGSFGTLDPSAISQSSTDGSGGGGISPIPTAPVPEENVPSADTEDAGSTAFTVQTDAPSSGDNAGLADSLEQPPEED